MAQQIEINARVRARAGTSLVRRLRREGDVPAVIYGGDKENQIIAINHDTLLHSLDKESFHSGIININIDGTTEQAILRDVDLHPYKKKVMHADFQRIDANKAITMSIPIHFIGEDECKGVNDEDGILSRMMTEVEIYCLPKHLPEYLQLDVTNLGLNESLHLSNIELPEGVQLTAFSHGDDISEYDYSVISVMPPQRPAAEPEDEEASVEGEAEKNSETE